MNEAQENEKKKTLKEKGKEEGKGMLKDEVRGVKSKVEFEAKRKAFRTMGYSSTGSIKEDAKRQGMNKVKELIRKKLFGR